jgi:hypothetical protein
MVLNIMLTRLNMVTDCVSTPVTPGIAVRRPLSSSATFSVASSDEPSGNSWNTESSF